MKKNNCLDACIADMPIRIETNDLNNLSYIRSVLKGYLKPEAKPYFSMDINTFSKNNYSSNGIGIKINRRNGCLVFISQGRKGARQELGRLDRDKRRIRLNLDRQTANMYFYFFLRTACSFFLCERKGLILHAAGVIDKNRAYLFIGPSGSGKSTVASILEKKGYEVISDEKLVVQRKGACFKAVSFPWYNYRSRFVRVDKIFFLKKSSKVAFKKLTCMESLKRIFSSVSLNITDKQITQEILNILCSLFKKVPAYEMEFLKNDMFWEKLKTLD